MLVSDITRLIQRRVGDSAFSSFTQADVYDWATEAQNEIARETEIIYNQPTGLANAMPINLEMFSNSIQIERVVYGSSPLKRLELAELDSKNIDVSLWTGRPYFYYVRGTNLYLYPNPDSSDTTPVIADVTKLPTALSTTGQTPEIPTRYHWAIVHYCCAKYYERVGKQEWYDRAWQQYKEGIARRVDEATRVANETYVIADDGFDLAYDYLM